uniref:Golgi phosphoprotein 3 n=1 Tax=Aceria tosichella TaxID=561515 RepID=A0A6G1SMH6_9ACAR
MSSDETGLVRRRVTCSSSNTNNCGTEAKESQEPDLFDNNDDTDARNIKLSLLEEVFLLGLKDRQGYTSFWNDCISIGLRGCILAELVLRKRITLDKSDRRRTSLSLRKVHVINAEHTGDALLDEALKHIHDTHPPESIHSWIYYLSGETWNPFNLKFQLKNVRERIAKNLVEKGVLSTEKKSFVIFDMTTHPLVNCPIKSKLVRRIQDAVLSDWVSDPHLMDKRLLALIILAYHSDVLENAFGPLSDDDYETAMSRSRTLLDLDMDYESSKPNANEALWAVFAAISK